MNKINPINHIFPVGQASCLSFRSPVAQTPLSVSSVVIPVAQTPLSVILLNFPVAQTPLSVSQTCEHQTIKNACSTIVQTIKNACSTILPTSKDACSTIVQTDKNVCSTILPTDKGVYQLLEGCALKFYPRTQHPEPSTQQLITDY